MMKQERRENGKEHVLKTMRVYMNEIQLCLYIYIYIYIYICVCIHAHFDF